MQSGAWARRAAKETWLRAALMSASDERLLADAAGDQAGTMNPRPMAILYSRHKDRVLLLVRGVPTAHQADQVQRCFERLMARARDLTRFEVEARWAEAGSVARYLSVVAKNLVRAHYRRGPEPTLDVVAPPPPDLVAETRQQRDSVWSAVEQLADRERQLLVLHYQQDLSLKEVAARLEKNESTVRTWHRRALKTLARALRSARDE